MRVLAIGPTWVNYQGGGVWVHTHRAALWLAQHDIQVDVLTADPPTEPIPDQPYWAWFPEDERVDVRLTASRLGAHLNQVESLYALSKYYQMLIEDRVYDLVISLAPDVIPVMANSGVGVPHYVYTHMLEPITHELGGSFGGARSNQEHQKALMLDVNLGIAFSNPYQRKLMLGFDGYKDAAARGQRSALMRPFPPIDPPLDIPWEDMRDSVFWIGTKTKGSDLVIKFAQANPELTVDAFFYGSDKQVAEFLAAIPPNVNAKHGWLEEKTVLKRMRRRKVGLVASRHETYSLITQEHLLYHPTIVVTDDKPHPWHWYSYFDPCRVGPATKNWTPLVRKWLRDRGTWTRRRQKGWTWLAKEANVDDLVNEWRTLIEEYNKGKKTNPRARVEAERLLETQPAVAVYELTQSLGWQDLLGAQRALVKVKQFLIKIDTPTTTWFALEDTDAVRQYIAEREDGAEDIAPEESDDYHTLFSNS